MAAAFTERIGPFVVPGAGHFLQWERAGVLNQAIRYFCRDLLS
jgi:pimeloyl-ACP methyl ester carboxylesterase